MTTFDRIAAIIEEWARAADGATVHRSTGYVFMRCHDTIVDMLGNPDQPEVYFHGTLEPRTWDLLDRIRAAVQRRAG